MQDNVHSFRKKNEDSVSVQKNKLVPTTGAINREEEINDAETLYKQGLKLTYGVDVNHWKAEELFKEAAKQGHTDAQYELGLLYYDEFAIKAVQSFRAAAEQGHADAQCELARCYYGSYGIDRSVSKALKWYKKAIKNKTSHIEESRQKVELIRKQRLSDILEHFTTIVGVGFGIGIVIMGLNDISNLLTVFIGSGIVAFVILITSILWARFW